MSAHNRRVDFLIRGHQDSMGVRQWRSLRKKRSEGGRVGARRQHQHRSVCTGQQAQDPTPLQMEQTKGRKVIRMLEGWLGRNKSVGKGKKATFHSFGEPISVPAQSLGLKAAISPSSSLVTTPETVVEEESGSRHRKRVSFDLEVTTVIIAQMSKEDLDNTFYTRREFCAFKDAYRTHRDMPHWSRENDGLPCNCKACSDDGSADGDYPLYEAPESPPVSPPSSLLLYCDEDESVSSVETTSALASRQEGVSKIQADEGHGTTIPDYDEPPSPVGATFGDGDDGMPGSAPPGRRSGLDAVIARTQGKALSRKVSWERRGVSPNVVHAVAEYGEEYAYKRLRLQGFSDHYIREHFLPAMPT